MSVSAKRIDKIVSRFTRATDSDQALPGAGKASLMFRDTYRYMPIAAGEVMRSRDLKAQADVTSTEACFLRELYLRLVDVLPAMSVKRLLVKALGDDQAALCASARIMQVYVSERRDRWALAERIISAHLGAMSFIDPDGGHADDRTAMLVPEKGDYPLEMQVLHRDLEKGGPTLYVVPNYPAKGALRLTVRPEHELRRPGAFPLSAIDGRWWLKMDERKVPFYQTREGTDDPYARRSSFAVRGEPFYVHVATIPRNMVQSAISVFWSNAGTPKNFIGTYSFTGAMKARGL